MTTVSALEVRNGVCKPDSSPEFPYFSCGPTKKRPGFSIEEYSGALFSRSHRSPEGLSLFQQICNKTRELLEIPQDYKIIITAGSATGATECAFWSLLGARGVDIFAWEIYGKLWASDIVNQLKIQDSRVYEAEFGSLPNLSTYDPDRDTVFVWNGTTSGVWVPHLDWIHEKREGLVFCDATSAVFCAPLDWNKLDVTTFSWQKGLGGEAGHGMIILSPRALNRLESHTPSWPIPHLFSLKNADKVNESLFNGVTVNTTSLLGAHDFLKALEWAEEIGGMPALLKRNQDNFNAIDEWLDTSRLVEFLVKDRIYRSQISVVFLPQELQFSHQRPQIIRHVAKVLAEENVAYDIINHALAPISFRLWCGPTVESNDLKALTSWIDYALKSI